MLETLNRLLASFSAEICFAWQGCSFCRNQSNIEQLCSSLFTCTTAYASPTRTMLQGGDVLWALIFLRLVLVFCLVWWLLRGSPSVINCLAYIEPRVFVMCRGGSGPAGLHPCILVSSPRQTRQAGSGPWQSLLWTLVSSLRLKSVTIGRDEASRGRHPHNDHRVYECQSIHNRNCLMVRGK